MTKAYEDALTVLIVFLMYYRQISFYEIFVFDVNMFLILF